MHLRIVVLALMSIVFGCSTDGQSILSQKQSYVKYTESILVPTKQLAGGMLRFEYSINGKKVERSDFYKNLDDKKFLFGRNDMKLLQENKEGKQMIRKHFIKGYTADYIESNLYEPSAFDVLVDEDKITLVLQSQETGPMMTFLYDANNAKSITASPFYMPNYAGEYEMTQFIKNKEETNYRFISMVGEKFFIKEVDKKDL